LRSDEGIAYKLADEIVEKNPFGKVKGGIFKGKQGSKASSMYQKLKNGIDYVSERLVEGNFISETDAEDSAFVYDYLRKAFDGKLKQGTFERDLPAASLNELIATGASKKTISDEIEKLFTQEQIKKYSVKELALVEEMGAIVGEINAKTSIDDLVRYHNDMIMLLRSMANCLTMFTTRLTY
jgi:hypothetical protein